MRRACATAALRDFGVEIDPAGLLGDLDLATQQLVLIVRALSKNARLLILDEPTAALTERETMRLFERMRALSARGVAIIFVSHRLAEVFEISNRIVIMRDGRISGSFVTAETSRDAVVDQMIGTSVAHGNAPARNTLASGVALEARDLCVFDPGGREVVSHLDIEVRHGEVLGLFGLLGSGVIETTMALFGAWRGKVSGEVALDGMPVSIASPSDAVMLGMGLIAQDRRDGLSGEHSIYDNAILADLGELSRHGFIDTARRAAQGHRPVRPSEDQGRRYRCAGRYAERRQPAKGAGGALARRRRQDHCCLSIPRAASTSARGPRSTAYGPNSRRQAARSCWSRRTPKKSCSAATARSCCAMAVTPERSRAASSAKRVF